MKITKCPDEFKEFVKTCSAIDLAMLIVDLKKHPEDIEYLLVTQKQMGVIFKEIQSTKG